MVGAKLEQSFIDVEPKMLHASDHGKQLFFGDKVILLRWYQSFTEKGDDPLSLVLHF